MFDLCPIDWSGIAAIISFLMVVLTTISLFHSRKQLNELKRQWNAQNTPIISCSLEKSSNYILIDVHNSSNVPAHKVKIHIQNNSSEKIFRYDETNLLLNDMAFEISPFSSKQIPLWITPLVDGDYQGYITITVEYSGKKESFDLFLKEINLTTWKYSIKELCDRVERIEDTIKDIN